MFKIKPYKILWSAIPVVILAIVILSKGNFVLQFHDTYYVISPLHFALIFTFILCFMGGLYWLLGNYSLNKTLNALHAIVSTILLVGLCVFWTLDTRISARVDRELHQTINSVSSIFLIVFLLFQIVFILNIVVGLMRGKLGVR